MTARVALALLSGVLLFASFSPLDVGWLAWVALAPLILAVQHQPLRHAFGLGYLAGAVAFGGILMWIRVFGLFPWVLLTAYLALYPAVFAALTRWFAIGRPAWRWVWLAALAWVGLEYLRSIGVIGFPWALLGVSQHRIIPVLSVARYAGVYGVSFLIILANTSLAGTILVRRPAPMILPAIILALVLGRGFQLTQPRPSGTTMVAAVQPNVPQAQKFDPTLASDHLQVLQRLVGAAGRRGADLIVLPETAVPLNLFGPGGALVELRRWTQQAHATIIASSLENGVANIAVAVPPTGQAVSRYDKVRLVAFGEAGIVPGARHDPLRTSVGSVGVAICFESIFPDVTRALVRNGAQLVAIITNDAWFDGTAGPAQHAAHAVLRAVESGRWVVRAANTGLSMIIDPSGRVRARVPPGQDTIVTSRVAMVDAPTFYAARGDLFAWAALVTLLVASTPAALQALSSQWSRPVLQYTMTVAGLPWIAAMVLQRTRAPWWGLPLVLAVFLVAFSLLPASPPVSLVSPRRRARGSGWRPVWALVGGLAVVLGLWSVLTAAFRAYGVSLPTARLADGWVSLIIRQLLIGAALELWLRGVAFAPLERWLGPVAAIVAATAIGLSLQTGHPEAYAWALATGAAFGIVRARTGSALGLIIPHAIGNWLFFAVAPVL